MTIRFIHTSDWQIGKVFRFVDNATMGLLQEARLAAITRLGELARAHQAARVLVAGDVYDGIALSARSLNQPLERMRNFPAVHWHLLPGNHDPHRPNGLWDQLRHGDLPPNVHLHTAPEPAVFADDSFALLPAPLLYRHTLVDPTAYMDDVELSTDLVRIGLAHGTVVGFTSDETAAPNRIAPDRARRSGLSYLALGDWHGQKEINERSWYSGTPETDSFQVVGGGKALLVELEGAAALPSVSPLATGHYTWLSMSEHLASRADIDRLADKLRAVSANPERVLVRLTIEGALSLEDRQHFEQQIRTIAAAALCFLAIDDRHLLPSPTAEDLDRIDRAGFIRAAAEELKHKAGEGSAHEREIAALALQRLYVEHMKLEAGER